MYKYLINKLKNERGELFSPAASYFLSEKRIKDSEKKAADAAAAEAEKAREEQRRIEELYGTLTPEEKEREKRAFSSGVRVPYNSSIRLCSSLAFSASAAAASAAFFSESLIRFSDKK